MKHYNLVQQLLENPIESGLSDKVALEDETTSWTYEILRKHAQLIQATLEELNIPCDEIIMCVMKDSVVSVASFLGIIRGGHIASYINPEMPLFYYQECIATTKPKAIIIEQSIDQTVKDYFVSLGLPIVATNDGFFKQSLKKIPPIYLGSENRGAFCLFTSGTTGCAKAVIHRHKDVKVMNENYGHKVLNLSQEDVTYSTSRLYFAYGLNSVLFALYNGGKALISANAHDYDRIWQRLSDNSVTIFFSVPTLYHLLLAQQSLPTKLSIRLAISAGEHLPDVIQKAWLSRYKLPILDGIGSTEILSTYISNRPKTYLPASTGQVVPGFAVKVCDNAGIEVPVGQVGQLWVKGDTYNCYYLNNMVENDTAFVNGWFNSQDLFSRDKEGNYYYHGRANDLIKSGGIWINPYKLETVIQLHPDVSECIVIGETQQDGLVRPVALVIPKNKNINLIALESALKKFCKEKLSKWQYPHFVRLVNKIPKGPTGKKLRRQLKGETLANR